MWVWLALCVGWSLATDRRSGRPAETLTEELRPYHPARPFGSPHPHSHVKTLSHPEHEDTYELYPAATGTPGVSTRRWVIDTTPGYVAFVENPLQQFAVYDAVGGGCKDHARSVVTATARKHRCTYAQNAGFFNTETGACYNNIVSDGVPIQHSGLQNTNFGILKNGTIAVGYLPDEMVDSRGIQDWQQLVTGVLWLVRNGKNYVDKSYHIEDLSVQETGKSFVTVRSARTAVGHDAKGRVVFAAVEGQSWQYGVDLYELADALIDIGVVNAVNLDGGGSMTVVVNGTLASVPSDPCERKVGPETTGIHWRCERPITTVVCAH